MDIFERLPTVRRCCCCVPLRVGSCLIATAHLISIFSVIFLTTGVEQVDDEDAKEAYKIKRWIYIAVCVPVAICALLVYVALSTDNETFYAPYMWATVILIGLNVLVMVAMIVDFIVMDVDNMRKLVLMVIGESLFNIIVYLYFLIVINSQRLGGED